MLRRSAVLLPNDISPELAPLLEGDPFAKAFALEGEEILQVRLSILRSWGADAAGVYGVAFW